jgi:hypothetical protein
MPVILKAMCRQVDDVGEQKDLRGQAGIRRLIPPSAMIRTAGAKSAMAVTVHNVRGAARRCSVAVAAFIARRQQVARAVGSSCPWLARAG